MIENKLTYLELKSIICPILRLEDIVTIKKRVYKVFHFERGKPTDKQQYLISSNNTGIISSYRGFEIEVRSLHDRANDYIDVFLRFTKKRTIKDFFINSHGQIIKELKQLCESEIFNCWFTDFDPGGITQLNVKEKFFHQLGARNPDWELQNKLSPLTIFSQEKAGNILIEFLFSPDCYERRNDKTVLKEDWLKIFELYCPSW